MNTKGFHIEPKKTVCETAITTIRIPKTLLAQYDEIAAQSGYSRSEVMLMALNYAIENLQID